MQRKVDLKSPTLRNMAIIILFGIFLLCFLWIDLYLKVQSERQLELKSAAKVTANLARAFEEHTLRTVKSADQAVLYLKHQYEQEGRAFDFQRYFSEEKLSSQPFVQLGIIDENGDLAITDQVPFVPVSLKDREHFRVHRNIDNGQLFISKPVLGRASGKWSLQMTRRINKPDGSFDGVAVVSVDPFYFSEFYKQVDLGKDSAIVLVGRDGIVRARQSEGNTAVNQDLTKSVLMEKLLPVSTAGSYIAKSPVDGVTRLYSYRALKEYPLIVSVGISEDVILAAVNERIAGYYQVAAMITFVIVAFIAVLLNIATRQKRTEAALKEARDDLELQVEQRTGELYAANCELQKFNQDLEEEIAERTQVEEALRQKEKDLISSRTTLSLAMELANLGPWEYDPETDLFEFGDEFYSIYGTDSALEGCFMTPAAYAREFVHPEDARLVAEEKKKALSSTERYYTSQLEHRIIRRDGEERTIVVRINVIRDADGKIERFYGANQDITEWMRAEEALQQQAETIRRMAYFDSLTGLPNRLQLSEVLGEEMERARRGQSAGFVFFIDLDDLKMVNDTYGHTCGDDIIIAAGNRIVAEMGNEAFVARVGGDEFIVIFPGRNERQRIDDIAGRIIKALGQKHEIFGTHFHMTASIGIAAYPADGDTAVEIVKNADNAMYAAKKGGKNCWRFYTAVMQTEAYEKIRLTGSLREALERGELSLAYQPQVLVTEGTVVGFEALLRWNSAEHGQVPPEQFIPLAEQSGLIHPIGLWVLREACRFARRLSDAGWGGLRVAVNISSKQLADDDFTAIVGRALEAAGVEPRQLELEITESVLITSLEDATGKLAKLKALGVGLSLDDFGTGYSSLTYLRKLPVKTLKIDKSFIDMITTDDDVAKIIGSIIDMAHILNMTVVAEGVETEEQLVCLADNGCDRVQGYIFSRPVPETEAIVFLDEHG